MAGLMAGSAVTGALLAPLSASAADQREVNVLLFSMPSTRGLPALAG